MISTPLTPTRFFIAAVLFLSADAVIHLLASRSPSVFRGRRWRHLSRLIAILALLCIAIGLVLFSTKESAWPLQAVPEVIIASVAAAILWQVLCACSVEWKWEALFYLTAAALVVWGIARWPSMQRTAAVQAVPQSWLFISHLALALACGAFIYAGTTNLACLLTEKVSHETADVEGNHDVTMLGFPFLSASLLLTVVTGLYTRGVYWNWSTAASWRLLTWFFYVMIWCAWVVLGWRGRRIWVLTTLGMVLILLTLHAI